MKLLEPCVYHAGAVADTISDLLALLSQKEYEDVKGDYHGALPARPIGMGTYALTKDANTSHLSYNLKVPEQPGVEQEMFNIKQSDTFVIVLQVRADAMYMRTMHNAVCYCECQTSPRIGSCNKLAGVAWMS